MIKICPRKFVNTAPGEDYTDGHQQEWENNFNSSQMFILDSGKWIIA